MIIVVMGVSGSGKTTVGQQLATQLGWSFIDADDFHPAVNVAKMGRGEPLTDSDRRPWLVTLQTAIAEWSAAEKNVVLACSALRASYRQMLDGDGVRWVYLRGDPALIHDRLQARSSHFMPPALLESQFEALEPPTPAEALIVDIGPETSTIVEVIYSQLF